MINYPNKKPIRDQKSVKKTSHANRGINFENLINSSNEFFIDHDLAYIYKKPTPIKVIKVNFTKDRFKTKKHKISEAYFETPSTTDYNGIYRGRYIDFEAKQSKYLSFNVGANLKAHQVDHLANVWRHGAISFLIIHFQQVDEVYILFTPQLLEHYQKNKNTATISIDYFKEKGYLVEQGFRPSIDYLKILDIIIDKEYDEPR